ncbi:MAG: polyphosphate kinase 1 [Planctomycetota bacterium]|nr:MAG: polyphosphate kinase 1 [Planctomycetota bacterium]
MLNHPSGKRAKPLDEFRVEILNWLEGDRNITAREIYRRLSERIGDVSERSVRRYVAELKESASGNGSSATTVAASATSPSETFQEQPNPEWPSTPADQTELPSPLPDGNHDLSNPGYFLNRELTWLNFNFRVLREAEDPRNPLMERVKFLAIVSSNLDEFFMKRIGGLKQQVGAGVRKLTVDGRTPEQQIHECVDLVRLLEERKRRVFKEIKLLLQQEDIYVCNFKELEEPDKEYLRDYYFENIYPLVTPQATDPAHPFPFVSNLSLNLLVSLRYPDDEESHDSLARVKVPIGAGIPRFFKLPERNVFVPMEGVIANNLDLLFPGMEVNSCATFRVTRNANTESDEDTADDLLSLIESELRQRKFAPIVRLEVQNSMDPHHRGMLAAELGLDEHDDVHEVEGMLGMRDLMELMSVGGASLRDKPHHSVDHPELQTDRNIFHIIRDNGPILLHHPYEAFATSVERFLREASRDPKVRAIKMCLYRTSSDTKVINYLIDAARNGKQVAVVVELKARFDEAANIRWANRMEEAGIHVTYGVVGLKTHCKVILVVRQDYDGLKRYAHIGTGNYHAGTARLYSDLGMLTCDRNIGKDLTELLNYLTTGFKPKRNFAKLLPAPKVAKPALLEKIQREIEHARAGQKAHILFKMNALEDSVITRALYKASQAGVRVELIIRDTCRLRPGIPGLSENARVISVVGRFLEHTRIYHFHNNGKEEFYLGSADCMSRNLNSRVEVLAPIEEPHLTREVALFLEAQLQDRRNAWEMRPDGSYFQWQPEGDQPAKGSQELMIDFYGRRNREVTRLKRRRTRGFKTR